MILNTNNESDKYEFFTRIICPVNKWKTATKYGKIITCYKWKKAKEILQMELFLNPWHPQNESNEYSFSLSIPEKDRKDIDAGIKFYFDVCEGPLIKNDRQIKRIEQVSLWPMNYYGIRLTVIN